MVHIAFASDILAREASILEEDELVELEFTLLLFEERVELEFTLLLSSSNDNPISSTMFCLLVDLLAAVGHGHNLSIFRLRCCSVDSSAEPLLALMLPKKLPLPTSLLDDE